MRVTRVVATAPSERARGIAASLATATQARMPLALASAQAASTSRRPMPCPRAPGRTPQWKSTATPSARAMLTTPTGAPSRTATSEADDGCRTASASAAQGAPNTSPWTSAQSRTSPAVTDPAQLHAGAG